MGIEVLPPDINASDRSFAVHDKSIRFGLGAVKGVGTAALDAVMEVRGEGAFSSLYDFCQRVDLRRVNKKVVEALIKCGAFDSLGAHRAQCMGALEEAMEHGQKLQRERAIGQESLFGAEEIRATASGGRDGALPAVEPWDEKLLLTFEKEALGFFITGHPLDRYRASMRRLTTCQAAELLDLGERREVKLCGIVTTMKEHLTKKGDRMAFVTLEDLSGSFEAMVPPQVFAVCHELLKMDAPLLVSGRLEVGEETCKIIASEIGLLSEAQQRMVRCVNFRLSTLGHDHEQVAALQGLVKRHRGDCEARLHVVIPNRSETIIRLPEQYRVAANDDLLDAARRLFGDQAVSFD